MNLTAKSRYAFKVMIALARKAPGSRAQRSTIAAQEAIPAAFLSQIVLRLQRAGLIQCWRGRTGGLSLARHAQSITALEIIEAAEDDPVPVTCLEHAALCQWAPSCNSRDAWVLVDARIREALGCLSLGDMAAPRSQHPRSAPAPKKRQGASPQTHQGCAAKRSSGNNTRSRAAGV
jgi:Rrf2 family iron-sulfur cluster assembly transcriptional regulator